MFSQYSFLLQMQKEEIAQFEDHVKTTLNKQKESEKIYCIQKTYKYQKLLLLSPLQVMNGQALNVCDKFLHMMRNIRQDWWDTAWQLRSREEESYCLQHLTEEIQ